jgi:hypothetical protein
LIHQCAPVAGMRCRHVAPGRGNQKAIKRFRWRPDHARAQNRIVPMRSRKARSCARSDSGATDPCADGQITSFYRNACRAMSSPSVKNIYLPFFGKVWFSPRVSCSPEGRCASSSTWSAGCDGRGRHHLTSDAVRGRAKSCCPDPPTLGSSPQWRCRPSAGRALRATEANKPGTPRRPRISRKPLRRECRCFGVPVAFLFCMRAAGATVTPGAPCALSFRGQ